MREAISQWGLQWIASLDGDNGYMDGVENEMTLGMAGIFEIYIYIYIYIYILSF